jgi:signal transduction histidine kinase/ActR/RegA family two-component response regulator
MIFGILGVFILLIDLIMAPTFARAAYLVLLAVVAGYSVPIFRRQILRRNRLRVQLEAARARAEAGNEAKSEFLATMSHEMRTPMNAIIGMTELALHTELTTDQRRYLETVKSSADSMNEVINDILDFSKTESGKLQLNSAPFRLRQLVAQTIAPHVARAMAKNLDLRVEVAPEVPDALVGDGSRIGQILTNLVNNAIKFTDEGSVVVRVKRHGKEASPEDSLEILFSVSDTGIGIPPDKQHLIFESFAQVDTSTTRKYGGTGLGLSIASRLAQMMGGMLRVESAVGNGSTFSFTVKLAKSADVTPRRVAEAPKPVIVPAQKLTDKVERPLQVLLAEDNPVNQQLAVELLQMRGHSVTLATNGREVLAALDADSFDVVLMDVNMPEMDGFQTTAAIREREKANGRHLPIIAITGFSMKGDRERCLRAGMDAYLCKPIRSKDLFEAVEQATTA